MYASYRKPATSLSYVTITEKILDIANDVNINTVSYIVNALSNLILFFLAVSFRSCYRKPFYQDCGYS